MYCSTIEVEQIFEPAAVDQLLMTSSSHSSDIPVLLVYIPQMVLKNVIFELFSKQLSLSLWWLTCLKMDYSVICMVHVMYYTYVGLSTF